MLSCVNPLTGEPPTGEPDAGESHVRFGGRGNETNRVFLPLFYRTRNFQHLFAPAERNGAPESTRSQRGASPLQVNALRPVTECNCDAVMRGGEQQEVNDQSVG